LSSWQRFLSTLNNSTPSDVVWRRIKSIQGKAPNSIPGLSHAGWVVTEPGEVSEILACTFGEFSSSRYDERFVRQSYIIRGLLSGTLWFFHLPGVKRTMILLA